MANLLGQNIGTNYKGILNLNTLNGNLSGTLQAVTDGDGNASPLRLSTTAANINTPFTIGTMSGSVWNVVFDMTSGTNPGGYMNWKLANDATSYYSQFMQGGDMNFFTTGSGYNYGMNFSTSGVSRLRISPTGLIQFGGTTNAFPALKRNSAALELRLADDSSFANLSVAGLTTRGDLFLMRSDSAEVMTFANSPFALDFGAGLTRVRFQSETIAINSLPDGSAALTIASTTRGFLPPRMTTTQKNAIGTPTAGLVVYDTTLGKLCVRTASAWETITSL